MTYPFWKKFNYVISPNHDNFVGDNVLNSVGALHHFRKVNKSINPELLTCIVGGDNRHYHFDYKDADKLCEKLLELKKNHLNIDFKVITSRRTSQLVKNIINKNIYPADKQDLNVEDEKGSSLTAMGLKPKIVH